MGEILPDGTIQGWHSICRICGAEIETNIQGDERSPRHKCKPIRIQRKRTKGFNLQAESLARNGLPCIYVGRPTYFGNEYRINTVAFDGEKPVTLHTRQDIIDAHARSVRNILKRKPNYLQPLRGKNLACWCREGELCHANILLELANK